jgi:hypothetical protein
MLAQVKNRMMHAFTETPGQSFFFAMRTVQQAIIGIILPTIPDLGGVGISGQVLEN